MLVNDTHYSTHTTLHTATYYYLKLSVGKKTLTNGFPNGFPNGFLVCHGAIRGQLHLSCLWRAYVSIRQHTSAYVSIRQHTCSSPMSSTGLPLDATTTASLDFSLDNPSAPSLLCMQTYVSIRQHTSAYVSIRQHPSAPSLPPSRALCIPPPFLSSFSRWLCVSRSLSISASLGALLLNFGLGFRV
jgi:hypothetical protein